MPGDAIKIFDFPGGIHPLENKSQSNGTPIETGPLPPMLVVPLQQHIGAPAKPVVEVGDHVLKGQKIADCEAFVSAPKHAPSSGTVVAIEERPVMHPSQISGRCIVIETDGKDQWIDKQPVADYTQESADNLRTIIREAGITGMGGAGFPTSVKLSPPAEAKIEQLILNSVECEPYITADDRLIRERAAEVIAGLEIAAHIIQPQEILIGIEDNKPEAIEAFRAATSGKDIQVIVVPTKYPSGGEKQIIQLLTGKEVPSGRLPADVGVVCQNTGTIYAIYQAVVHGEPLVSRITTLTGNALARPGNVEAMIGTPIHDLLEFAGADAANISRLVMGGPMMGFTLHSSEIPVVKSTNCILAATTEEIPPDPPEQPCIRCGTCADYCPMTLLPQQLFWFSKSSELEKAKHYNLMDCIECGVCSYVCPSNIPLVQYFRHAKGEIRQQQVEQEKSDRSRLRFEARKERLEKEAAEKEARRKARAEAAKARQATTAPAEVDEAAARELENKLKILKAASTTASKKYKTAVKAYKEAEESGSTDAAELKTAADEAKAEADKAKAAVREAKAAAPAAAPASAAPQEDPLKQLKEKVNQASREYKTAVKAYKEADANGDDNAAELKSTADELKGVADQLKAELREAKASAPASPSPAAASALATTALATTASTTSSETGAGSEAEKPAGEQAADEDKAKQAAKMKALKTAAATTKKQLKEATEAFEKAQAAGTGDLDAMQAKIDKLQKKADIAANALAEAVEAFKGGQ